MCASPAACLHDEACGAGNQTGSLVNATIHRDPAFEARSHSAERPSRFTLRGCSKHRDAKAKQRHGDWHALRDLVAFPIDMDLDQCGHVSGLQAQQASSIASVRTAQDRAVECGREFPRR